eukprot:1552929-Amphidinium_carterae.1
MAVRSPQRKKPRFKRVVYHGWCKVLTEQKRCLLDQRLLVWHGVQQEAMRLEVAAFEEKTKAKFSRALAWKR